jgi:hypothetical protein
MKVMVLCNQDRGTRCDDDYDNESDDGDADDDGSDERVKIHENASTMRFKDKAQGSGFARDMSI